MSTSRSSKSDSSSGSTDRHKEGGSSSRRSGESSRSRSGSGDGHGGSRSHRSSGNGEHRDRDRDRHRHRSSDKDRSGDKEHRSHRSSTKEKRPAAGVGDTPSAGSKSGKRFDELYRLKGVVRFISQFFASSYSHRPVCSCVRTVHRYCSLPPILHLISSLPFPEIFFFFFVCSSFRL